MKHAGGFSYVGVLVLVSVLALVAALSVRVGALVHRRAAEQALLEAGAAFSQALGSYARATPAGRPDAPETLHDLLRDPRQPGVVRHLRRLRADPFTGSADWGLERDPDDGRILGVYSLAAGEPIKRAGFDRRFPGFAGQRSYQDWKFLRPPDALGGSGGLRRGLMRPGELDTTDAQPDNSDPGERNTITPKPR